MIKINRVGAVAPAESEEIMKKEITKIELVKEGIYYTLYINGESLGCGDLEDLVDGLEDYINSYITGEYKDIR